MKCGLLLLLIVATGASLRADQIDEYVRAEMKHRRIPGMALAIVKDGKVVKQQAYGLASVELNVAARPKTVFLLASLTKTFTSAAILLLIEDGKFSLDDSVTKFLPDLPASWAPVTVRHCLSHTSGLPDIWKEGVKYIADTRRNALQQLAAMPVKKPGAKAVYNQTGYMLLGMIIEKVTGTTFEEFIIRRLLRPLEMTSTRYGDARDIVPERSSMYTILEPSLDRIWWLVRDDEPVVSPDRVYSTVCYVWPRFQFTGVGLNSNIEDMTKWELALASGRVLKSPALDETATPFILNDGENARWGLGWRVGTRNGHRTMMMGGGWATVHLRLPDDDLSVIVLTNLQGSDPGSLAMGVAGMYVPDLNGDAR
ncbi:MAG: beta-lactamase family protein [Candidatus Brocadiales bacterium]|nr:beta-lactamase family protein [Candidatus Bathyanammoxibius sp.]